MAINDVKLLKESIEDSITSLCAPYCEPEKNQLGLCPSTCISFCYPICNRPFLDAFPPPQPDYITTTTTTSVDDHHQENQYKSSQILSIYLSVLVIGLVFVLCFVICKLCTAWYKSRTETSQLEHQEDGRAGFLDQDIGHGVYLPIWYARRDGLQQSVISSITIFKYKKGDGLVEGTECAVCLNEFQENETLRLLPKCSHAFHIPCIDTWLTSNTNCPMCRAVIVRNPLSLQSPEQNVDNSGVVEVEEADLENEFEMEKEYDSCGSSFEYENEDEYNSQIQSALKRNQDFKEESENVDSLFDPLDLLSAQSDAQLHKVNESSEDVTTNRSEQMKKKSFSCSEKQVFSRYSRQVKDI